MRDHKYASTSNKAIIRPKFVANYSLVMKNLFTAASYVKNIINEFVIKVYNQDAFLNRNIDGLQQGSNHRLHLRTERPH